MNAAELQATFDEMIKVYEAKKGDVKTEIHAMLRALHAGPADLDADERSIAATGLRRLAAIARELAAEVEAAANEVEGG